MEVSKCPQHATTAHEAPPTQQPLPGLADHAPESRDSHPRPGRQPHPPAHPPTDDEILGLDTASPHSPNPAQSAFDFDATSDAESAPANESAAAAPSNRADEAASAEPANFRNIFEANPELRQAWQDAQVLPRNLRHSRSRPRRHRPARRPRSHGRALLLPPPRGPRRASARSRHPRSQRLRLASTSHHQHGGFVFRRGTAVRARHQYSA